MTSNIKYAKMNLDWKHYFWNMNKWKVIGIMSGTSLDGLDIAYCEFWQENNQWKFNLGPAETILYNQTWKKRLGELHKQLMFLLPKTDAFYGKYIGQCVNEFVQKHKLQIDFISSHGHTIFHNPSENYTTQIGSGAAIYAETGIPTICDFRSVDVAFGGQGAPLVPIGDELLFSEFQACLNLGGFANISYSINNKRLAFDICPCNILLNKVAQKAGFEFDENGTLAKSGIVHEALLNQLNQLPHYAKSSVKSLGREWVEETIWPIVQPFDIAIEDLLATFTEHIAFQIASVFKQFSIHSVLCTGGGTYNQWLMETLTQQAMNTKLIVPEQKIIDFKEAFVFGFLGVLRMENQVNSLKNVTGASKNNVNGCIYGPLS